MIFRAWQEWADLRFPTMRNRLYMLATLPLLLLDCIGNMLVFGNSWRFTISGEAWNQRHTCLWCWKAIDAVFGQWHCKRQCELETAHGGVWAAWVAQWKAATK